MRGAYVFEQVGDGERERLAALEEVYDEVTRERITALGLADGWRCLEVGCGAGSIARWLAHRVGGAGEVLAIDLDPRFLQDATEPGLRVLRHDVTAGPLPGGDYDLVHARAVLEHLPQRDEVLRRMAGALRLGGRLVVEDFDIEGPMADAVARYWPAGQGDRARRLLAALRSAFTAAGVDVGYGRRLPEEFASLGLTGIGARIHAPLLPAGTPFLGMTLGRMRPRLVATGLITDAEVTAAVELTRHSPHVPNFMVTAWGHRPGPGPAAPAAG
ncbi:methyltransferase domain-containing protein [Kitasatospora sp. NBC_00374]|uniref:methyltransferase domain-containing protein n=1 Tax=Kitasatospora sp. NBC_00374 TaxID=2975964 RepID=UPI0030E1D50D